MSNPRIVWHKEVYGEPSLYDYIKREVFPYEPFFTMRDFCDKCDVEIHWYGFTHDTGFVVHITEHDEDRTGKGWNDLDKHYHEACREAMERWEYCARYGYH